MISPRSKDFLLRTLFTLGHDAWETWSLLGDRFLDSETDFSNPNSIQKALERPMTEDDEIAQDAMIEIERFCNRINELYRTLGGAHEFKIIKGNGTG